MHNFLKKIILVVLISLFIFPATAIATSTYETDQGTVTFNGLVPCGEGVEINGEEVPCQFCHIFVMFNEILEFIWFTLAPPIIALLALVAAFLFIFAGDDPKKVKRSREIIKTLVVGTLLVYGSWLIVNLFFTILDVKIWEGGGWSQVQCQIEADPSYEDGSSGGGGGDDRPSCSSLEASECADYNHCEWSVGSGCRATCNTIEKESECPSHCRWDDGACIKIHLPGGDSL